MGIPNLILTQPSLLVEAPVSHPTGGLQIEDSGQWFCHECSGSINGVLTVSNMYGSTNDNIKPCIFPLPFLPILA